MTLEYLISGSFKIYILGKESAMHFMTKPLRSLKITGKKHN